MWLPNLVAGILRRPHSITSDLRIKVLHIVCWERTAAALRLGLSCYLVKSGLVFI